MSLRTDADRVGSKLLGFLHEKIWAREAARFQKLGSVADATATRRNWIARQEFGESIPGTAMAIKRKKTEAKAERKLSDSAPSDAIAMLENDHREVESYFEQYKVAKSSADKKGLAVSICEALRVHAQIEEELFYPAARKATRDHDLLDEATVEHAGAKVLIAEIEAMQPGMPLYDAKVTVLGEQIQHHVKEEERELFPKVRKTHLDLEALGAQMAERKAELISLLSEAGNA
jgi:hemerythrin superfamily protein